MARRETFLGFDRAQIQGGLILPALVGLGSWLFATQSHQAASQEAIADVRHELDQMQAQIRDLQARCTKP